MGIEHIDELVRMSVKNVQADDPELLSSGRIKFVGESGISSLKLRGTACTIKGSS